MQGQAGNAVQYLSRNQALKKLQVQLGVFRQDSRAILAAPVWGRTALLLRCLCRAGDYAF